MLRIEREISDVGTWLETFERFATARDQAGVTQAEVFQPRRDPIPARSFRPLLTTFPPVAPPCGLPDRIARTGIPNQFELSLPGAP